jgi:hypothetical protein
MEKNAMALRLNGEITSAPRDLSVGLTPLLDGGKAFYVEFAVQLSDNDQDHFPALWLMPIEHDRKKSDCYPGDPVNFERWQEIDVDEGGFSPGLCESVHAWSGSYPDYQSQSNLDNLSWEPIDRSKIHTFGLSFDPQKLEVTWWLDNKRQRTTSHPNISPIAAKQHYYLIISAKSQGKQHPYLMKVFWVQAYAPLE